MRRIRRAAVPVASLAVVATAATAWGSNGFPVSIYPPPVAAVPGHAVALCPNHQGLQPFTATATSLALRAAASYDRRDVKTELHDSDRAWWPGVRRLWRTGRPGGGVSSQMVLGSEPAAASGFAVFLRPACGTTTLRRSLVVTVGPSQAGPGPHCNACNAHLFFIDRRGRPLIYFLY